MTELTRETIIRLLETNDVAVARALVVLFNRQTSDEKNSSTVRHLNNSGFRPCGARVGTSMAKFYINNNFLSAKQIAYWRRQNSKGVIRIGVYWRQLIEQANINKKVEEYQKRKIINAQESYAD